MKTTLLPKTAQLDEIYNHKFKRPYSPRQLRVINALLIKPLSREEVDRIAGASNGPAIISQIRINGLNIVCEMVSHIDRDGRSGKHGVYHLPPTQRTKFLHWQATELQKGLK